MKRQLIVVAMMSLVGTANALTLVQIGPSKPSGSSTLFNAIGTFNFGNNKARLEAAGQTTLQGGNPGNGWWGPNTGMGGPQRSWEVIWNNTAGSLTFNVYSNPDFTGLAMSMTRIPTLTAGHSLVGLDIGSRLTAASHAFTYSNVEFNGGSGFVAVPGANASYSGDTFNTNYFSLDGTLGDFTLRGNAQFTSGTVTSDGMRFFVTGVQAVPEPGTLAVLGLGLAALARRKRASRARK